MNVSKAIDTIYTEREKFIIVGMTGRTGSGCTTVSDILSSQTFKDLHLRQPKSTDFNNNDERKYQIIYNYAEKHWTPFIRISMTDMIFSFIIQHSFDEFISELEHILNPTIVNEIKDIIDIDYPELKAEFKYLHNTIKNCINEKDSLDRTNKNYLSQEYEMLFKLSSLQTKFRHIMRNQNHTYKNDKGIEVKANTFTFCLQEFGNRIRHHGDIIRNKDFSGSHMFALARRANDFIKAVRYVNKTNNEPTFICLDAIRNPYEATYFQDRYSSFYLIAVSTDDDERIRRLGENYDNQQIKALDNTEYPRKLKGDKQFTNQNIGACAQLADIYLYNPRENTDEKFFISELAVKYITLIKHPGLITPSNVERCMQIAYNAKLNSGCLSRQVGAVITDANYSVKAVGWNSVAEGQVPCNLRSVNNYLINKDAGSFSTFEIEDEQFSKHIANKYSNVIKKEGFENNCDLNGRLCEYCFKDEYEHITGEKNQVHTRSLHAEENAFLQIVKYGGDGIKGGNLFTSSSSCVLCSKKAYQLGIKNIYYIDPYPDIATSHILSFGADKSKCPKCHLFYGAIGKAYTSLFTQRIAIKDELKCLIEDNDAKVQPR